MKSHPADNALPAKLRFHLLKDDGLHHPIQFTFVSEQMHRDILDERQAILDALPQALRAQQMKLFSHYDPQAQAKAFQDLLRVFGTASHA